MENRAIYRALAAACLSLALTGFAGSARGSASSCSEVLLVTADGRPDPAGARLAAALGRLIDYYVGEERAFEVSTVRLSALDRRPEARNVVICGVADPVTDMGKYLGGILGEDAFERIRAERSALFRREDVPGPGQLTVVVTAASAADLLDCVDRRSAEISEILESGCRERLRRYFAGRIDKELSRKLRGSYGFSIEVPGEYRVLAEGDSPPGVQLICEGPARLLGVTWLDWEGAPTLADSSRLFAARARYVWDAYEGDAMDSTRVAFRLSRLGGFPALEMSGYWSSSKSLAGGYYRTFFVYEAGDRLLWAVDLLVFAPGLPKHPLLRELHAIAETFRYD